MVRAMIAVLTVMALAACGADYRPGVSGSNRILPQNLPSNAAPEAPGARPR